LWAKVFHHIKFNREFVLQASERSEQGKTCTCAVGRIIKMTHVKQIYKLKNMEQIQNLLNQISIITKKNAEILDASGGRFNMFAVCGVNHYENTHSKIIAEFLNPNGSHGLKAKLLDQFIATLGNKFTINGFDAANARIYTEYAAAEGRMDIVIEDHRHHALIIENKIYAGDQKEQLKRYNQFAENKYGEGNYQILYLTLSGGEAESAEGVTYECISYKEDIINWLDKCVSVAVRHPMVRESINQYINHLKQLTNQDMDTKNKEEIVEILANPKNLKAAQKIHQNYDAIFDSIARKYILPKLEKFEDENKKLKFDYPTGFESFIKLDIEHIEWKKCRIQFNVQGEKYICGIVYKNPNNKISKDVYEKLHEKLPGKFFTTDWWPALKYIDIMTVDSWCNIIENKGETFSQHYIELINDLLVAAEGLEL
jgi:hypothetical protein